MDSFPSGSLVGLLRPASPGAAVTLSHHRALSPDAQMGLWPGEGGRRESFDFPPASYAGDKTQCRKAELLKPICEAVSIHIRR